MQQDQYWQRLNGDLNSLAGNAVRDYIIAQLPQYLVSYGKGQQGLTAQGKRDLAESVVKFVLRDRFDGNWVRMKGTNWCSVMASDPHPNSDPYNTEKDVDHLMNGADKSADAVLNRYITMGKSQRARIDKKAERITPVLYTSLTGFDLITGQSATTSIQSQAVQQFKIELVKPVAVAVTVPDIVPVAVPDVVVQQPANDATKSNARAYLSKARKR